MFFHQQNSVSAVLLSIVVLAMSGCDSWFDQSSNDDQNTIPDQNTDDQNIDDQGTVKAHIFSVGVGPLANATVLLERYVDGQGWVEETSVVSDGSGDFDTSTMVFESGVWYRFTATGGTLLDANFDGVQEDSVSFNGQLRAIALGDALQESGGLHIDFTAEVAYTHVLDALNEETIDWDGISTQLDEVASQLFFADVNTDGVIDYSDIISHASTDTGYLHTFNLYNARRLSQITASGLSSTLTWMPYNERLSIDIEHTSVYDLEFNADQTVLYAASSGDGLTVVDLVSGEVRNIDSMGGYQNEVEVDHINDLIYVNRGSSNAVSVLDAETETEVDTILSDIRVNAMDINQAGTTLYYGNSDGLFAYDITSEAITTLSSGDIRRIRLADDERTLLVGGYSFAAEYDLNADEFIFNISLSTTGDDVHVSADGTQAYVANSGDGFTLIDVESETYVSYESPDGEDVYNIFPLANGREVLVLSEEGVFTFDLVALEYVDSDYNIDYLDDSLYSAIFIEEQNLFFLGGVSEVANTYVGVNREQLMAPINTNVYDVIINDGRNEVVFGENDELGFLDLSTGNVDYIDTTAQVERVRLSEDGDTYFVSTTGAGIDLVDVETRALVNISSTDTYHQVLDHEGLLYALNDTDEMIDVYNASTRAFVETIAFESTCEAEDLKMDSARDYLYVACDRGNGVRRYHIDDRAWETFVASRGYGVEISDDEQTVFGGYYYEVYVVDIATNTLTTTLPSHNVMDNMEHAPNINGLFVSGGSAAVQFIDLLNEKVYFLKDNNGYRFAYDAENKLIYLAAQAEGLLRMDLSDF